MKSLNVDSFDSAIKINFCNSKVISHGRMFAFERPRADELRQIGLYFNQSRAFLCLLSF